MEADLCKQGYAAVEDMSETKRLKRTDACFEDAQKPYLGRHSLRNQDFNFAWSADLKVGFLYEVDHKQLPPKSPIQLKSIRAVMVAEKNEFNVSVRFPSTRALRTYFSENETGRSKYPVLDEQFVMGIRIAKEALIRQILPPEFHEQGRQESFWLLPSRLAEISSSLVNGGDSMEETSTKGLCQSSLNCDGLLNWGVRRRITFKVKTGRVHSSSSLVKEEDDVQTVIRTTKDDVQKPNTRKRKREGLRRKKKSKVFKREPDKKPASGKIRRQKLKLSYDRWSQERYKSAEVKMLEIMKEKGAVFGKPMLRPELRLEARKHIGDTGLLDHLLKHMAGKVAPNGEDRFRRRHNAEGAMEYWLESADLVDVRRDAGVNDPYWTPPPGWKPGDNLSQDHPSTAIELNFLKEEMATIKRDVHELLMWKREDDGHKALLWKKEDSEHRAIVPFTKSSSETSNLESDNKVVSPRVDYENLLKTKAELEQQLLQVSESLKGMQEEMRKCERRVEEEGGATSIAAAMVVDTTEVKDRKERNEEQSKVAEGGEEEKAAPESAVAAAAAAAKAAKKERLRSGFRICKPQGTFLWPNSSSSAENNPNSGNVLSPHHQMLVQVESLVMVPTPPSVSSATTSAPLFFPTPTSPVKPLPEKRPVTNITFSSSTTTTFEQGGDNISSTTTNASLHLHKDVNGSNHHGLCGTPSSCTTYQRALLIPSSAAPGACVEVNEAPSHPIGSSTAKIYQRKPTLHHHQHQTPEVYCGRSWLALGTPMTNDSLYFN